MLNSNLQTLSPGTCVNSGKTSYIIKEVLGTGLFGVTYLAIGTIRIGNVNFDVPFAIKEHFMQLCFRDTDGIRVCHTPSSKKEVELLRNEFLAKAKTLQKLCAMTKYIVKINEIFEANGTAYYVMEYLSGGSIKAKSKQQAIDYMLNISEAVKVLHENKVLHMDIKPSNVMLKIDEDTGESYPVLIDFGISRHFDIKDKPTTALQTNGCTTGYAPIEQYGEVTKFTPTIDIYAMGATLFYLLTEKNPPSAFKLYYDSKVIQETLRCSCCDEFIQFVTNAMAANHKDRYSNIDEFIKGLRSVTLSKDEIHREIKVSEPLPTTIPQSSMNLNNENSTSSYKGTTHLVYKPVFKFNGELERIKDPYIIGRLKSIYIAQNSSTKLFGIIDNQEQVIVPFAYSSIGKFMEIPVLRGTNFITGWRIVAPFHKNQENKFSQGGLEILSNGNIMETNFDERTQPYFPDEPRTREIISQQTFNVNGRIIKIIIQQIPWEQYGITDAMDNVIAPFIYDSIEPFYEYCALPGSSLPTFFFRRKVYG